MLLRDPGIMPINRVTAAKAGSKKARRAKNDQREEKTVHIEDKIVDGAAVRLYARGGAVGIGRLTDTGDGFVEVERIRTQRVQDKVGTYRWYNHYELCDATVVMRLHGNEEARSETPQPHRERRAHRPHGSISVQTPAV
jgi:hypothetical protein